MTATAKSQTHYLTLDALRGVAALAVAAMHISQRIAHPMFLGSYVAVDFFFILSGFVLGRAYDAPLASGRMGFATFAAKRIIRLWPMIAFGTALEGSYAVLKAQFAFSELGPRDAVLSTLAGMFVVPLHLRGSESLYAVNGPIWSLLLEIIANLTYAAIATHLTMRRLIFLLAALFLALVSSAIWFGHLSTGMAWGNVGGGLARVGFGFFLGILLWRLHQTAPTSSNLSVVTVAAILAASLLLLPGFTVWDLVVVAVVMPALVVAGSVVQPTGFLVRPAKWLGEASFAIYTVHIGATHWTLFLLNRLPGRLIRPEGALAICLLVSLTVALVATRQWDAPVRRWLSSIAKQRSFV